MSGSENAVPPAGRAPLGTSEIRARFAILDEAPNAFMALDREWRYAYINAVGARQVGKTPAELVGRVIWEVFPEAVGGAFWTAYHRAMEGGELVEVEDHYAPLDLWFEARAYPIEIGIAVHFNDVSDRKRVMVALAESQRQLMWAQELAQTGSYSWEIATGVVTWSPEMYRILGLPGTYDPHFDRLDEIVSRADLPRMHQALDAALAGIATYDIELRMRHPLGEERIIHTRAEVVRDPAGAPLRLFGVMRDVTEARAMKQQLESAEMRWRAMVFQSPDSIAILDDRERIVFTNSQTMDGLEPASMAGTDALMYVAPFYRETARQAIRRVLDTGEIERLDVPIEVGGVTRWYASAIAPLRLADGTHQVISFASDVTERREMEVALRESEERYRVLFEQAGVGVAHVDAGTGRFLRTNRKLRNLFGYSEAELLELSYQRLTHPDDLAASAVRADRLKRGEITEFSIEKRYVHKSGHIVWVALTVAPIRRRDSGPILDHIAVLEDITERKEAEAALRESEARYRSIYDNIQDVYVESALDGTILEISPQIEVLSRGQYRRDDYIGQSATAFYADPARRDVFLRALQEHGSVRDFETEFVNRDGALLPCSISARLVADRQGQPPRLVATLRDISERKRMEDALRVLSTGMVHLRGEAFFNEIARQLAGFLDAEIGFVGRLLTPGHPRMRTLGLCIAGRVTAPVEFDLSGTPCESVVGKQIAIYPEDLQQLFPAFHLLADLDVASYAAAPLFDAKGELLGAVGIMSRKPLRHSEQMAALLQVFAVRTSSEIERQLADARFHDLFEFAPDAMLLVNREGLITMANQQAASLFGHAREELIGLPIEALMPGPLRQGHPGLRREFMQATVSRAMGKGRPLYARRKDGTLFAVEIGLSPIESEDGSMVVAAVRDVSERERAEEDRRRLETQLRQSQRVEALGTLAGGIAHDFNNILGAIVGHLELALHHVTDNPQATQSIEAVQRASHRARDLVRRILMFSQQEGVHQRVVALRPIVEEAVSLLRATIPATVALSVTSDDPIPDISADTTQLHQVIINLCTNAWQAMERNPGAIAIRLDGVTVDDAGTPGAELRPGRYARLTVADTGCGMDAVTIDRIFEPFFTTKGIGTGTGLGLSVVHGIVRAHGGTIDVRSELGRGTTFDLYFPAAHESVTAGDIAISKVAAAMRGEGQRVLFLDDEDDLVQLAEEVLGLHNYRVSGYRAAEDAVAALRADPYRFDVVVSDLSMPVMSGLDVAREVLRLRPDLPVVIISGHMTEDLRAQAVAIGVREVMRKPFEIRALADLIDRVT